MSESSAFANYSNTTQQLRNQVDQSGATETQITNDKANFEQQFLIGAALAAKVKAVDKFTSLLKKSKKIQSLKGKGEDVARRIAKSAQDRAEEVAKELASKIKGVTQPQAPPVLPDAPSPNDLKPVQDALEEANKVRDATRTAKQLADEEVENSTADLAAKKTAEGVAKDVADNAIAKAASGADGAIRTSTTDAIKARDLAEESRMTAEARSALALKNQGELADQLAQHEGQATRAAEDVQRAVQSGTDAEAAAAEAAAADVARVAKAAQDSEKALKVAKDLKIAKDAKDVEETAEGTSEADPLGLLIAAGAAIATQVIGRKIKAHEEVMQGGVGANVIPNLNYSSTLGA